jgi:hypothetical protein
LVNTAHKSAFKSGGNTKKFLNGNFKSNSNRNVQVIPTHSDVIRLCVDVVTVDDMRGPKLCVGTDIRH